MTDTQIERNDISFYVLDQIYGCKDFPGQSIPKVERDLKEQGIEYWIDRPHEIVRIYNRKTRQTDI